MGTTKCPKCGSSMIHHRIKTKDIFCKRCGELTPWSEVKENE